MWDGQVERVSVTKYCIQKSTETAMISSNFYRARCRQQQLEREEVNKVPKDKDDETAATL